MNVSIIFPVKNEGENLKNTLRSLNKATTSIEYEIIVVNDASVDDGCDFIKANTPTNLIYIETDGVGAARARNIGASQAHGEFLVFCDGHLEFADGWLDLLLQPLAENQSDAVAPAIGAIGDPHFVGYGQTLQRTLRIKWLPKPTDLVEVPILPGACLAIRKEIFDAVGGFEQGFLTWGHEDVEFSIRLWLFGYRCHVLPSVKVLHLFRKQLPYHVGYEDLYYNILWMAYSHFNEQRLAKVRQMILPTKINDIQRKAIKNGVLERRKQYLTQRKHSDDWYFTRFDIQFN